ncbi:hypothetical protein H072_1361 [Dactylellina haptotyla CBS 200.50]|uniref:DUF1746 domain-containing protein n=1 Tax=Dactylellina haptotyla (strain CBS 200.50) TaxID=1284197 RepID=S8AUM3_DACHA|nr:hypothetical protein H072_1361 [Dactylellina haptotyla CBS 200.50]
MPAGSPDDDTNATASSALHSTVRARDQLTTKKSEWLDHMLRNLDIVTYCHFSYLYFLDISFIRFLIRAIVQINLFAQRPPNFPTPQRTQKRSAVVSIFGSTLICFLFHLFSEPPSASEATGGYLHGGMVIDFVGQEGPISRLRLIFLDLAILVLQLIMLTVKVSKQDLLENSAPGRTAPAQDIDDEERGMTAGEEIETDDDSDFGPSADDPENEGFRRRRQSPDVNLYSGEIIIADLRVVETVRSQWNSNNSNNQLGQSASAAMAANLANARLRMLFRR